MVTIQEAALTIAGGTYNPGKPAAFILPTAFSGLTVSYGGDSCADHPGPGSISGRVFIPEQHAAFHPRIADPVHLRATINGDDMRMFYGTVDEIVIEDVDGEPLPAIIPNSRGMQNLAGWTVTTGTTYAGATPVPATYLLDGARVSALGPTQGATAGKLWFTTPAAPVSETRPYVVTVMAESPTGLPALKAQWLNGAGVVIKTEDLYRWYTAGSFNGDYSPLRTNGTYPPVGAKSVRIIVECDLYPNRESWQQACGVDGIVLHELPYGTWEIPTLKPDKRPPGRWVTFKASDILATAARLIVGTTPWPSQTVEGRTAALNALVPAGAVTFNEGGTRDPFRLLGPRDIDKQNMLEIFQRVLASSGDLAVASSNFARYVVAASLPRYPQIIDRVNGVATIVKDPLVPELPAGSIVAGPMQTDITTMANQIRVEYRVVTDTMAQTGDDASAVYVNADSLTVYGAMGRSISTDLATVAGSRAEDKARRLAESQAQPFYRLADKVRLVSSQIPDAPNVARLYSADIGFGQLIYVPDAPAVLGNYHRVRGATLTLGREPAVELDVEPPDYSAPEALTFGEARNTTPPFNILKLSEFQNITIGQLKYVSALEE